MTFAEEKTYEYIRHHYRNFYHVHVLEILPYLSCLTTSDQDLLRAHYDNRGNRNTIWELFNSLQRRSGWVESLIRALRACELSDLADEVDQVYQSNLPLNQRRPPAPLEPPSVSAEAPGPSTPAVAPSASHKSYSDEEQSYPMPVQDTQLPASMGESSKKVPQTASSGADLKRPSGPLEPSSDMAVLSPLPSSGPQKQDVELGSTHTTGMVSGHTSPRGPVSPTVSFQPLARSTPRASRLPGPPMSALSTGTSSSSAGGVNDHAEATICSSGVVLPTNSVTTSIAPSKVPLHSAFTNTVPSKLSTSSKTPGKMSTNVPTSLAPSKLPVNSTRAGTVPPKVPTGLVPEHRMPTSLVPSKVPANTASIIRSSNRPAEETSVSPALTGASAGGSSPYADSNSNSWGSGLELSKPGGLSSKIDGQPFSGCSADLAISYSSSLDAGPDNTPEENEYMSGDSHRIHVVEGPSADLLAGNPGLQTAPQLQEEEVQCVDRALWVPWLGAATAAALLATLLAVLYRRRLLQ
ncbi:PREDICTED: mitochondrial antiviral-signaling protein [Miniopterus natalensis]|uniref:mitochondrial antiviral-signaling protein n=1 Tax=Miniopterus natalensis TaxID=291302 RepID=UPI0007A70D44|nr:PREDICTED: mitochondrial antiviral-signaling protein [Miniopterus natalensis]